MTDNVAVGLEPFGSQLATPDYVVAGVERDLHLHAIAFGSHTDQRRAVPISPGASVILSNQESAVEHLICPVRHQDCIERLGLPHLASFDHNHEIGHRRDIEFHLRFRRCSEVLHRTDLDEKLRRSGKPRIIIPLHGEFFQYEGLSSCLIPCPAICLRPDGRRGNRLRFKNDGTAPFSPILIFPSQYFQ